MKATFASAVALLLITGAFAHAQQPIVPSLAAPSPTTTLQTPVPADQQFSQPNLSLPMVTPELWLYSQEWRRHDDPAQAVRRKAEARTEQRMARLAALRWYGYSNIRPQASVTPFTSIYSPAWIGNGYDRYDWVSGRYSPTVVRIETIDGATLAR